MLVVAEPLRSYRLDVAISSMAEVKRILNGPEAVVHERLVEVLEAHGARVFPKMRVADVFPIESSGISREQFTFALRSHFDFVVAEGVNPLFAVEYDGPKHSSPGQICRDALKDQLCERFAFPILRINSNHVNRRYRALDLLTWFVKMWFSQRAIEEAYAQGNIPPDADVDAMWLMSLPGHTERFPLMFGLDAQSRLRKMHERGLCPAPGFNSYIGYIPNGAACGLGVFQTKERGWIVVHPRARSQRFEVPLADLLQELMHVQVHDALRDVLAGRRAPLTDSAALDAIERCMDNVRIGLGAFGYPFPHDDRDRPVLRRPPFSSQTAQ